MLRRFASDCNFLFTANQVAPETSNSVSSQTLFVQCLENCHLCSPTNSNRDGSSKNIRVTVVS